MPKLDFEFRVNAVNENIECVVVAKGEDFGGNQFEFEIPLQVPNGFEQDFAVPGTPCDVHVSVFMETPVRACVDGHLQCGPLRVPTQQRACVNL
jgi:hypothetical protein